MASFTSQMKNKQTKKQTPAARELKKRLASWPCGYSKLRKTINKMIYQKQVDMPATT